MGLSGKVMLKIMSYMPGVEDRKRFERRYGCLDHGDYGKYIRGCARKVLRDERQASEEDQTAGEGSGEAGHP